MTTSPGRKALNPSGRSPEALPGGSILPSGNCPFTIAGMNQPDPERTDDENPEITPEEMERMRPAREVLPHLIGQNATDELMRGNVEMRAEGEPIDWSACPLVEVKPGVVSGAPVLKDTRMPVDAIVGNFDYGESAADIAAMFEIPLEKVEAVLEYAKTQRYWARLAPMQARNREKLRAMLRAEGRDPD